MKTTPFFLALALLFTVSGCIEPEEDDTNDPPTDDTYRYFDLTMDGTTVRYGSEVGGAVFTTSEGEQLGGVLLLFDGRVVIELYTDFYYDNSKSSGVLFTVGFDYAAGVGSVILDETKFDAGYSKRIAPGDLDPLTTSYNYGSVRKTREMVGSNCVSTTAIAEPLTVTFTEWSTHSGDIIEGTIEGIVYENDRSEENGCQNSVPHPFSLYIKVKY